MPQKVNPGEAISVPNISKFILGKGVTLPTEPYGGDKFGSIRIDLSLEARIDGDKSFTQEYENASKLLDILLNKQVEEEINGLKKGGK